MLLSLITATMGSYGDFEYAAGLTNTALDTTRYKTYPYSFSYVVKGAPPISINVKDMITTAGAPADIKNILTKNTKFAADSLAIQISGATKSLCVYENKMGDKIIVAGSLSNQPVFTNNILFSTLDVQSGANCDYSITASGTLLIIPD